MSSQWIDIPRRPGIIWLATSHCPRAARGPAVVIIQEIFGSERPYPLGAPTSTRGRRLRGASHRTLFWRTPAACPSSVMKAPTRDTRASNCCRRPTCTRPRADISRGPRPRCARASRGSRARWAGDRLLLPSAAGSPTWRPPPGAFDVAVAYYGGGIPEPPGRWPTNITSSRFPVPLCRALITAFNARARRASEGRLRGPPERRRASLSRGRPRLQLQRRAPPTTKRGRRARAPDRTLQFLAENL